MCPVRGINGIVGDTFAETCRVSGSGGFCRIKNGKQLHPLALHSVAVVVSYLQLGEGGGNIRHRDDDETITHNRTTFSISSLKGTREPNDREWI